MNYFHRRLFVLSGLLSSIAFAEAPKFTDVTTCQAGGPGVYKCTVTGSQVTPDQVKDALSSKLSLNATVAGKDLTFSYKGSEGELKSQLSTLKISKGGDTNVALESGGSDGGVRALKSERHAEKNEVKASFLSFRNGRAEVRVLEKGPGSARPAADIPDNGKITITGADFKNFKREDNIFFGVIAKDGSNWKVTNVKEK